MTPRRILLLAALLFSCATLARGQTGLPYQITPPVPNASFTVCSFPASGNPCSNAASIFADAAESSPITQPVQLGSSGTMIFYVSAGSYTIQFSGTSSQSINFSVGGTGGGGGLSGQTAGCLPLATTATTSTSSICPAGYAGVSQIPSCITGSNCAVAPEGVSVDTQSSATPSVTLTDRLGLVKLTNNTTSTAVTVPQSGATNFDQFFSFASCNSGTVVATFTPTTSTVNGNTTLKLPAYQGAGTNPACSLWYGDNTNYTAFVIPLTDANGLVPNAGLTNATTTPNGVSCALGSTCNVGSLFDTNGLPSMSTTTVASQVNAFTLVPAITGGSPALNCTGSDTNISCSFNAKGTGTISINSSGGSVSVDGAGNVKLNPASGSSATVTALGTGGFSVVGSVSAADIPMKCKYGLAAPTGDCFQQLSSTNAVLSSLGPSGIVHDGGTQIISGADYTNSTVTPSTVFSWTLPPTAAAKNYRYLCSITWESTNTTLVGPVFGLNISAAPTQLTGTGYVKSALNSITNAEAEGYISNTTTGSQTLVTGNAAGVTSTNYKAEIWGTIEGAPTAGSTFIINAASTSGTTATLNIRRGSSCVMTSTN